MIPLKPEHVFSKLMKNYVFPQLPVNDELRQEGVYIFERDKK